MADAPHKKSDTNAGASRLYSISNFVCLAFGVFCLALGVERLWQSNIPGASLGIGAGVLLVFAATVDRFESLKGLGIEAKTRQIDAKLAQADEALERIRELSELAGASLVFLHSKIGRRGAPSTWESNAVACAVKASLVGLGSSESKIKTVLDPWMRITCGDILEGHAKVFFNCVSHHLELFDRASIDASISWFGEGPESLRIQQVHASSQQLYHRLENVRSLDLQTLPGSFLTLYDDAPWIEGAEVAKLRDAAERFMPVILHIRDELTMPNPERWCAAIDELTERPWRLDD